MGPDGRPAARHTHHNKRQEKSMAKVHMVTMADMYREPVDAWRVDRLNEEIKKLRREVIRLKLKCGEQFTMADLGFDEC